MSIEFLGNNKPIVDESVFISDGVFLNGKIFVGKNSSLWAGVMIRADVSEVTIGEMTNIQEGSIIHVDRDTPTHIGDGVTVGHGAILHGCVVKNFSLIGIGAIILDNAEIGDHTIIAAGSLIPPGKKIPPRSMVMGSPGKVVRELTKEEIDGLEEHARNYMKLANAHKGLQK
ncbi:MAG: gamma carbonic anhydrase family protein [Caldisericia bacterium]